MCHSERFFWHIAHFSMYCGMDPPQDCSVVVPIPDPTAGHSHLTMSALNHPKSHPSPRMMPGPGKKKNIIIKKNPSIPAKCSYTPKSPGFISFHYIKSSVSIPCSLFLFPCCSFSCGFAIPPCQAGNTFEMLSPPRCQQPQGTHSGQVKACWLLTQGLVDTRKGEKKHNRGAIQRLIVRFLAVRNVLFPSFIPPQNNNKKKGVKGNTQNRAGSTEGLEFISPCQVKP